VANVYTYKCIFVIQVLNPKAIAVLLYRGLKRTLLKGTSVRFFITVGSSRLDQFLFPICTKIYIYKKISLNLWSLSMYLLLFAVPGGDVIDLKSVDLTHSSIVVLAKSIVQLYMLHIIGAMHVNYLCCRTCHKVNGCHGNKWLSDKMIAVEFSCFLSHKERQLSFFVICWS
jgi:hypothetical protein